MTIENLFAEIRHYVRGLATKTDYISTNSFIFLAYLNERLALQCTLNFCIVNNGVPDAKCPVQSPINPYCNWSKYEVSYSHGHDAHDLRLG